MGFYNNLSEEYKNQTKWGVPPGRDEVIEFQILSIPSVKQNGVMLPMYSNQRIPNVDTVYDAGVKKAVQIAYVTRETGDEKKPQDLGEITFDKNEKCIISISGKEPLKFNLLYYLRASNLNESNPLAEKSQHGYLFKELEPKKTAAQKLKERLELTDCVNYIMLLKEAEVVSLLGGLKQQVFASEEENRGALVEFVQTKTNRDKFNGLSNNAKLPVAALITKAEKLELIRLDKDTKIWSYVPTNKTICQVAPQTDKYDHLIDYFHNNSHGRAMMNFIEKEIESMAADGAKKTAAGELEKTGK